MSFKVSRPKTFSQHLDAADHLYIPDHVRVLYTMYSTMTLSSRGWCSNWTHKWQSCRSTHSDIDCRRQIPSPRGCRATTHATERSQSRCNALLPHCRSDCQTIRPIARAIYHRLRTEWTRLLH